MDEVAVLESSRLDYYNSLFRSLSSFNMRKLQCIQNTLGRIVTHCNRYSHATPILKNSIGCQLNFGVFSKLPLWFISFFRVVTQAISVVICLLVVEDMVQDTTTQIKGSSIPISTEIKKNTSVSFAFDGPTLWHDMPDDVRSAPNLACFRKKLKSYLFNKAFRP